MITTGWHMSRATWLAKEAGVDGSLFPVDVHRERSCRPTLLDSLPNAEALGNTAATQHEIYGNLFHLVFR